MNKQAIEHFHESKYCFYIDQKHCLIRVRTARNDTIKKVEVLWNEWCQFWQEKKITNLKISYEDEFYSYYEGVIGGIQANFEYVIRITDGDGEIYYLSDDGITQDYDFSRSFLSEYMSKFPNDHDIVKVNPNLNGRLYYQIFPERFCCSNFNKDYINMKWDEKHVDNNHFLGGDLKGIISKIPYLKSLGVGGIWLNPIHPSDSAHKYDVNNYLEIDPMFGDFDDFKNLVKICHENDIKIVMDLVFNHCAFHNNLFQDVVKNGRKSKYYNWFFIDGEKPSYKKRNYLTFAHVANMPKLDTNNPEVLDYFKNVVLFWADLGVDGFRLDVAFEVSYFFWTNLKIALLEKHPNSFFIGEDWMNSEKRLGNYQWDSLMNYPFRYAIIRYFEDEKKDSKWIANRLSNLYVRYSNIFSDKMLNLLDSHDVPRWLNVVNNDIDFYLMSFAILMCYPGVPELYYGNEIFMEGDNDPFNRRGMEWDSNEFHSENHDKFLQILSLRNYSAVRDGQTRFGEINGVAYIKKFTDKQTITLYFYKGHNKVKFDTGNVILSNNYENGAFQKTGYIVTLQNK